MSDCTRLVSTVGTLGGRGETRAGREVGVGGARSRVRLQNHSHTPALPMFDTILILR